MGSAAVFFDYDKDGNLDVLLVNAGQDFQKSPQKPGSRLYHNTGDGNFQDVTEGSGLVIESFATGACVGDYDNDGNDDLFVTGFGRNYLFHNLGNGKFQDVTRAAGILQRPNAWGMGCAFVDINRDGKLDLYVANYVIYDPKIPYCYTANVKHGCTPNQYTTQPNELYVNLGGGKFEERAKALGAENTTGAGLGVLICDFDNDGWMDIFVANDGTPNALLHNQGGKFVDIGQRAGLAYGEDGGMRAGMGTDAGDADGDGKFDLLVTYFSNEVTAFYHNKGKMLFTEESYPSGIGKAALGKLKFGIVWADFDGDGKPDIYQGNGHVHDSVEQFNELDKFEEQDQVYHNVGGGHFEETLPDTGAFPKLNSVSRAVTVGDFNNDGRADILINSLGRPARLLENRSTVKGNWIGLKLIGTKSNRSAIGARIELTAPSGTQIREVRSGGSYLGQADLRVLFNLPKKVDPSQVKIRIRWPNGVWQEQVKFTLDTYSKVIEP
jgi:hypothetical protein